MEVNSYSDFFIFEKYSDQIKDYFSNHAHGIDCPKNFALFSVFEDMNAYLEYVKLLSISPELAHFRLRRSEASMWHRKIFEHLIKLILFYQNGFDEIDFSEYLSFTALDNIIRGGKMNDSIMADIGKVKKPCPWYCRSKSYDDIRSGKKITILLHGPEALLKKVQDSGKFKSDELLGNSFEGLYANWSDDIHSSFFTNVKHPIYGDSIEHVKKEIVVVGSEMIGCLLFLLMCTLGIEKDNFISDFNKNNLHLI